MTDDGPKTGGGRRRTEDGRQTAEGERSRPLEESGTDGGGRNVWLPTKRGRSRLPRRRSPVVPWWDKGPL